MKYYIDTEFIENGFTIELISIGIVSEDGREYYAQSAECPFKSASDFVWREVFPSLLHFNMNGSRSCQSRLSSSGVQKTARDYHEDCPWRYKFEMKEEILAFIKEDKRPEFWGYYADYDWVAFCQIFGTMMDLPKGFPMYCRDIKQLCDSLGNPALPLNEGKHNALKDAQWTKAAHEFLLGRELDAAKMSAFINAEGKTESIPLLKQCPYCKSEDIQKIGNYTNGSESFTVPEGELHFQCNVTGCKARWSYGLTKQTNE